MNKLKPNFTQIPNIIFDEWLPKLGYGELKVLLYMMRRIYGFHKRSDYISLTQLQNGIKNLDKGTGLSRESIIRAVESLESKGVILVDRKNGRNRYTLNFERYASQDTRLVKQVDQTSQVSRPKLVKQVDTQNKGNKVNKIKIAKSEFSPFIFCDYLKDMENSNERHIEVIAFFFKEKNIKFDSIEKTRSAIKRHLRAAKEVANFSDKEIVKATEQLKKEFPDYTIETILKKLTK